MISVCIQWLPNQVTVDGSTLHDSFVTSGKMQQLPGWVTIFRLFFIKIYVDTGIICIFMVIQLDTVPSWSVFQYLCTISSYFCIKIILFADYIFTERKIVCIEYSF